MKISKYYKFTEYLINSNLDRLELTYDKIEELMGFIPSSALKYSSVWNDNNKTPFTKSWTNAGYSIKNYFKDKKAVFSRIQLNNKEEPTKIKRMF